MNQRNTLKYNNGVLEIGGVSAIDLVNQYSTPLYVFDEQHIIDMCLVFQNSLKKYYGDGMISYASKAFCCKEIYRLVNSCGLGADVVSGGELYTAISVDFPSEKLIFHGNNKTEEELEFALKNKVKYVVLDSYAEIDILAKLCKKFSIVQDVLIRVNPGVEAHTHEYIQTAKIDSKFGFSIQNGDAENYINKVLATPELNLLGLHCHIGSQIFEKESFVIAVEKMTDFYKYLKDSIGVSFSVLDLGGGFGIYYSNDDPKLQPDDYENYVKVISNALISCVINKGIKKPYLILEPGRCLVGEAGVTLYKVGAKKEIKDVKNYLSIDGGMFENPRFALYQAKYSVIPVKVNNEKENVFTIAGKCCESGDVIAENVKIQDTHVGEYLAVLSTGAYNYSMASNYNRNVVPPVVMVKNSKSRIIVKGQTFKDLIKNDL